MIMAIRLSDDILEFIGRPNTYGFLSAARAFVALLESNAIDKNVFFKESHTKLLGLYFAAFKLDTVELKYSSAETTFESIFVSKNVGMIAELGKDEYYWETSEYKYIENGEVTEGTTSQGMLSDDFNDIYMDLKRALFQIDELRTDESTENGLWQLKWGFANHWGVHCISALKYLHHLNY